MTMTAFLILVGLPVGYAAGLYVHAYFRYGKEFFEKTKYTCIDSSTANQLAERLRELQTDIRQG